MSKAFMLVLAAVGLVLVDMSVGFVVHNQPSVSKPTPTQSFATPQASATRPIEATGTPGIAVCSAALLATAAAGILARARRASGIVRKNYGDFQPIVYESHEYASDEGYLPDGTPINQAGNNSLKRSSPPVDTPPPPVIGSFTSQDSHYGIKFSYSMQKDAYADLEYLNDVGFAYSVQKDVYADFLFGNEVGYLPDGTPMNKAGNCLNHPENIQPDPH
ncbi:Ribulose bisphosphate carboxylase, partial [Durusdinium trenchii]